MWNFFILFKTIFLLYDCLLADRKLSPLKAFLYSTDDKSVTTNLWRTKCDKQNVTNKMWRKVCDVIRRDDKSVTKKNLWRQICDVISCDKWIQNQENTASVLILSRFVNAGSIFRDETQNNMYLPTNDNQKWWFAIVS